MGLLHDTRYPGSGVAADGSEVRVLPEALEAAEPAVDRRGEAAYGVRLPPQERAGAPADRPDY